MLEVVNGNTMANVSFWPTTQNFSTPHYLCDSDITSTVTSDVVLGLAFVFYACDSVVAQLHGMANTFQVTSYFDTRRMIIIHDWTFSPFPSQASMIPTCFPSNLFSQILTIKNKLHRVMNSRSMNARNYATIQVDCIDPYTWAYMKSLLPPPTIDNLFFQIVYIGRDDVIAEKFRGPQELISLSFPHHLKIAQDVFGSSIGVGFRCHLSCQIGGNERVAKSHPVETTDTLNIIPFEGADKTEEFVWRGLYLKYLPSLCLLTVAVRFHRVKGIDSLRHHLQRRQMVFNEQETVVVADDSWSLWSNTVINGSTIHSINLNSRIVT
jgi:hypothetical protein